MHHEYNGKLISTYIIQLANMFQSIKKKIMKFEFLPRDNVITRTKS